MVSTPRRSAQNGFGLGYLPIDKLWQVARRTIRKILDLEPFFFPTAQASTLSKSNRGAVRSWPGLIRDQASRQVWVVDRAGLLTHDMGAGVLDYQGPYARPAAEAAA